jgi:hypothetical protein
MKMEMTDRHQNGVAVTLVTPGSIAISVRIMRYKSSKFVAYKHLFYRLSSIVCVTGPWFMVSSQET